MPRPFAKLNELVKDHQIKLYADEHEEPQEGLHEEARRPAECISGTER